MAQSYKKDFRLCPDAEAFFPLNFYVKGKLSCIKCIDFNFASFYFDD